MRFRLFLKRTFRRSFPEKILWKKCFCQKKWKKRRFFDLLRFFWWKSQNRNNYPKSTQETSLLVSYLSIGILRSFWASSYGQSFSIVLRIDVRRTSDLNWENRNFKTWKKSVNEKPKNTDLNRFSCFRRHENATHKKPEKKNVKKKIFWKTFFKNHENANTLLECLRFRWKGLSEDRFRKRSFEKSVSAKKSVSSLFLMKVPKSQ